MALMTRRLRRLLPECIPLAFGYPTRAGTISDHATLLAAYVETQIPAGATLSFVCHSLGSLVVRATAHKLAGRCQLNRAVLLGPPNQGAVIARFLARYSFPHAVFGPTLSDIGTHSIPTATDLLEVGILAGSTGIPIGFTPILPGDNDGLVLLKETYLEGAAEHKRVFIHHTIMPFSNRIARLAAHFIEHGSFSR